MEVRELLSKYEYDGENAPIIFGSALCALNGTDPELGLNKVHICLSHSTPFLPNHSQKIYSHWKAYCKGGVGFSASEQIISYQNLKISLTDNCEWSLTTPQSATDTWGLFIARWGDSVPIRSIQTLPQLSRALSSTSNLMRLSIRKET